MRVGSGLEPLTKPWFGNTHGDSKPFGASSLQLRVLCLGLLQDGDVGIGVFPAGQKVLVCSAGLHRITLLCIRSSDAKAGEHWQNRINGDAGVIN